MLSLRCCVGCCLVEVHRFLRQGLLWLQGTDSRASVVAAHGLSSRDSLPWSTGSVVVVYRLSCSVARGIFPDQGVESESPALAREPAGKPLE